jgi:hypothetical protein
MNSKIIIVFIGIVIGAVALVISMPYVLKTAPENEDQHITKGSISSSPSNFVLPVNYTSSDLLHYCTQNESLTYDDVCIRGLWDVGDKCKIGNDTSINSVCNDSRFTQFEEEVDKEMQDLNKSLIKVVDSCMNVTTDDNIQACSIDMERIKNDCSDSRFSSMWSVCNDPKMNQFNEKFADTLSKLKPEQ